MAKRGWLSSFFSPRSVHRAGEPRFELVVLEGAHAGECFPLRHDKMLIGRRTPDPNRPQEICLSDRSVSLRQATLEIKRGRVFIEHLPGATNRTIVNRHKVERKKLKTGDIIVLGLVVLELRETTRATRSEPGLPDPEPTATLAVPGEGAPESQPPATAGADEETWLDLKPPAPALGHEDETVIAEPNRAEPGDSTDRADTSDPEQGAATVVWPPPTPTPASGHDAETVVAEPNDTKPRS